MGANSEKICDWPTRFLLEAMHKRGMTDSIQLRMDCVIKGQKSALHEVPNFLTGEYTETARERGPNGIPMFILSPKGIQLWIEANHEDGRV